MTMTIADNLQEIIKEIPSGIRVVAVSKSHTPETIREAYDAGQRIFGENRVQELMIKQKLLPNDIEWHFIGHLQRNKVEQIIQKSEMIHSIDSLRLLKEVNKEAFRKNITVDCLLQFHIASEETKFGFLLDDILTIISSEELWELSSVNICGVMGMATLTDDMEKVRREFRNLRRVFELLKSEYFRNNPRFSEVSMGMSGDYRIAIEEGSTMLRLGARIFS